MSNKWFILIAIVLFILTIFVGLGLNQCVKIVKSVKNVSSGVRKTQDTVKQIRQIKPATTTKKLQALRNNKELQEGADELQKAAKELGIIFGKLQKR